MERVAIIARLTEASAQRATEVVEAGPPSDSVDAKPVMAPPGDGSESWA